MADMWSDNADVIIRGVNKDIVSNYGFSLSDFFTDPSKFASKPNILTTVSNIKEYVENYVNDQLEGLDDQRKKLNDDAAKCNAITSQLSQAIISEAKQSKIPVIKSDTVVHDESKDEIIYVKNATGDLLRLAERLVDSSLLVVDMTTDYNGSLIGEWLFSGSKNYVMRVDLDPNPILSLEQGMNEISQIFDAATDYIKARKAEK
jgi:hypothetical protein